MIMFMKSKAMAWGLAGVTALAGVALVVALAGGGDEPDDVAVLGEAAPGTSVSEAPEQGDASPTTTLPRPTTTETSAAPSATTTQATSTTTVPPATTTTLPPATSTTKPPPSDYSWVPKPPGRLNAVAPGGALTKHLAADIAVAFGFDIAEVEAAIAAADLPPEAGGNPEGWLAPGPYEPADSASAAEIVQAMVDRRVAQLEARGIARDQWYRVLTAASVIEKETYNQNEKPKVARVLANRLAGGGKLQMDSIILYPVPEDRIFTTAEERASSQPYNSYFHNGLPPTPISAPDEASIDAFLAPPPGDWWFYVTINLHTGETRYAVTFAEHEENVKLLRAWLEDNPTP